LAENVLKLGSKICDVQDFNILRQMIEGWWNDASWIKSLSYYIYIIWYLSKWQYIT
jgi:hypothetical protein